MHDPNKDPDFDSMTDAEAVARIGLAVDEAGDREDDELNTSALAWCDRIASRPLINEDSLRLDYFRSNALSFAGRRRRAATDSAWEWDQEEVQQQIFFLRRAMRNPVYDEVDVELQCQIQTNLATAFSFCGRLVEAICRA